MLRTVYSTEMKIGKITLYVNNQDQAIDFWTKKMHFEVKFQQEMGPGFKWVEVGSEDQFTNLVLYSKEMMLAQNPQANVGTPSILFSTTNIDQKYNQLQSAGVKVEELQKMPYGSMFLFYDQDGQQFVMREDK